MQILHQMAMKSSQAEFSALFSCSDSHFLEEELGKTFKFVL